MLSTLHTIDAQDSINRMVDFFSPHEQGQIRATLAQTLRGIISQRLVRSASGTGRTLVAEIMVNTGRTAEAIIDPSGQPSILELISEGEYYQMQTFDQHLLVLAQGNSITIEEALAIASNPHDLSVAFRNAGMIA